MVKKRARACAKTEAIIKIEGIITKLDKVDNNLWLMLLLPSKYIYAINNLKDFNGKEMKIGDKIRVLQDKVDGECVFVILEEGVTA